MSFKLLTSRILQKKNNKTIFLHIGSPKTATSSIQHQLLESSRELSRIGFEYCCNSYKLGEILSSYSRLPDEKLSLTISDWEQEIQNSSQPNLIISSESLYGDFYNPLLTTETIAVSLKRIFSKYSVIILFVAREQLGFHKSLYMQSIKEGSTKTYSQFCHDVSIFNFNWVEIADIYAKYFGANALKCFWYEDLISETSTPAEILLSSLTPSNSTVSLSKKGSKSNISLGHLGTEILRSVNGILSNDQRIKLWELLGSNKEFQNTELFSKSIQYEPNDEVLDFYLESNTLFTNKYTKGINHA